MGEVYQATDTNLKREVALKVLPASVASDAQRLARFQREAEVLAALNHPNIAAIYGLEKSDGIIALVMELVEGDDLSQRIARGAIPLDDALPIAKQIAEALEAAHEQGIIHRDLKPANIKVRSDGTVKVLDFGLAKAMEPAAGSSPSMSMSPTLTTPAMTQAGMILGTAAYMAPEQARGKTVDKRADIWAFGAVLFEMLTGTRAFGGEDLTVTLARVVEREPDFAALPASVPSRVAQALRVCLRKDPKQRVQAIGDVRLALDGAFETAASSSATAASLPARGTPVAWIAALAVAVLGMVAMAVPTLRHLRETPPASPPETRVDIVTPTTDQPASFALSPDGRQIVFVASGNGASRLWLRSLASTTPQPLANTEGATQPFWSPDSRSIGFFAGLDLKRLDIGGGAPRSLAAVSASTGGTWNADGVILFAPRQTGNLMRVSADGGTATAVTTLGPQQQSHRSPLFLPDGRRFLFYIVGAPEIAGIYLGALDGGVQTRLTQSDGPGAFLPTGPGPADTASLAGRVAAGWMLWVRAGTQTLVTQRLDVAKAELTGDPVMVADGVAPDFNTRGLGLLSVAANGLVAYRPGGTTQSQLAWFDRMGTPRGNIGDPDDGINYPRISPDGRQVVVWRAVRGNRDLWVLEGARQTRFTFDPGPDEFPIWSADGARIIFRAGRTGAGDLYSKRASGADAEERLLTSDTPLAPMSWSPDGRFLLYQVNDRQSNGDLLVLPLVGDPTPWVFLKTPFREAWGTFSPDGRWLAYQSNESGRMEVYVRPFTPPSAAGKATGTPAGQWQVSTAGGIAPAWRPDGKELYYLNAAGAMMAAPITVTGTALEPGAPVVLFATRIFGGGVDNAQGRQYDVAPDGRFLINTVLDTAGAPITLLMNWNPEAKK